MLQNAKVAAAIPVQDLARAKAFYTEKLGLTPSEEREEQVNFELGGSELFLFKSSGSASGSHTQAAFEVPDATAEIAELRSRGVTFEEYDLPGFKTENGVATLPIGKGGWFKDSEGNLLAVFQTVEAGVSA